MPTISSYDSSSMSILLSSLSTSSSSSSSSTALSNLYSINLSDYALIRSGAYYKLMSAYYDDGNDVEGLATSAISSSTSTSSDSTKTLALIEEDADSLQESASALLETGSDSVFTKVTTTDEDGNTTTDYDTDAIYDAVKAFVDDYNSLLDTASDSSSSSIQRAASTMANYSSVNENLLNNVGITVNSDGTLTLDEDDFKSADMSSVKSLFQDSGGYAYQVSNQATLIESYAKSEALKSNTYSSSGTYTYNYSTGTLYSSGA